MDLFNDYLEFKILPWHKVGVGKGVFYPSHKAALRLLKNERVKQKWEQYQKQQNKEAQDNADQRSEYGFGVRNSVREEKNIVETPQGKKYTEVIRNTATFPVPDYTDVENWNDKSWLKFAAPLELDEWYKAHPEDKPDDWVSPLEGLKTREEDDREVAEQERIKKEAERKALAIKAQRDKEIEERRRRKMEKLGKG